MRVLFLRSRLVVEGEEGQVEEVEEVEEVGVREEVSLRGTGVGGMIAFFGAFFSFGGSRTAMEASVSSSSSSMLSFR